MRSTGQSNLVAGCALQLSSELTALLIKKEFIYGVHNYIFVGSFEFVAQLSKQLDFRIRNSTGSLQI